MRDIYLIDFENVASEGLSGITYLAPEDEVIIFYSNNSKSLSMKMHILIGKSVCKLDYFEAAVGGKNALDHQISTWLGYLIGTHAAERNYYIVSRDMGYKFVASFWSESEQKPSVRCVESIKAASRIERNRQQQREAAAAKAAKQQAAQQPELQVVPDAQAAQDVQKPETAAAPAAEAVPEVVMLVPVPVAEAPAPEPEKPEKPVEAAEPEKTEKPQEPAPVRNAHSRQRYRKNRSRSRSEAAESQPETAEAVQQPVAEQQEKPEKPEKTPRAEQPKSPRPKAAKKDEPKTSVELTALIAPYPGLQEARLRELIAENKKQVLCNTLRKQLGQEKGLALYNAIKKSAWH